MASEHLFSQSFWSFYQKFEIFLFFERSKNQYFSTFFNKNIYIFQTKNIPPCSQAPGWLFDTTRWSLPSFSQVIKAGRKKVVFAEVPRSMWRRGRRKLKILFLNSATSWVQQPWQYFFSKKGPRKNSTLSLYKIKIFVIYIYINPSKVKPH